MNNTYYIFTTTFRLSVPSTFPSLHPPLLRSCRTPSFHLPYLIFPPPIPIRHMPLRANTRLTVPFTTTFPPPLPQHPLSLVTSDLYAPYISPEAVQVAC